MATIKIEHVNEYTTDIYVVEENSIRKVRLTDNNVLNKIKARKAKIKETIWAIICLFLFVGFWAWMITDWLTSPIEGYWAPDYVNSSGELIDTDGDGDFYHWYSVPTE